MIGAKVIEHRGIIKEVNQYKLKVNLANTSSCAGCHAKAACNVSDVDQKVIEVLKVDEKQYQVGQSVNVSFEESLGFKALLWGYLFPFLLVLSTLFILFSFTSNEAFSGLGALAVLVPYYFGLLLLRKYFSQTFIFRLKN